MNQIIAEDEPEGEENDAEDKSDIYRDNGEEYMVEDSENTQINNNIGSPQRKDKKSRFLNQSQSNMGESVDEIGSDNEFGDNT